MGLAAGSGAVRSHRRALLSSLPVSSQRLSALTAAARTVLACPSSRPVPAAPSDRQAAASTGAEGCGAASRARAESSSPSVVSSRSSALWASAASRAESAWGEESGLGTKKTATSTITISPAPSSRLRPRLCGLGLFGILDLRYNHKVLYPRICANGREY